MTDRCATGQCAITHQPADWRGVLAHTAIFKMIFVSASVGKCDQGGLVHLGWTLVLDGLYPLQRLVDGRFVW